MKKVEGEGYTLYWGDSTQIVRDLNLPSERVAIVADPPYGIAKLNKFGSRDKAAKSTIYRPIVGDDQPFDPSPWIIFPFVCLWGANWYADKLPPSGGWLIWDKKDGGSSDNFSDCEMAWTNCLSVTRVFRHKWRGMIRDSEQGEPRVHSTQKAITLMEWVLRICEIPKNVIIVDPYMGSATTGIAAIQNGYRFIGVEIDPHYFSIATERMKATARAVAGLPKRLTGQPKDYTDTPLFAMETTC